MRYVAITGVAAAVALIVLGVTDMRAALAGWLAALAFWSGAPLGALLLTMTAALTPGPWREETDVQARALVALLPLAAVSMLPILIGAHDLYPWTEEPGRLYLSTGFFVLRSIVLFGILIGLAVALMLRPGWTLPLSAGGIIVFVLVDTTLAADWLMSLEPHFHSSGFGLYVLAIQVNVALAVIVPMRLRFADAKPGLLGALMLAALLFWAYLAFMQYLISWSDNLPEPVDWYRHRGTGVWSAAEIAVGMLHLVPLLLLFLDKVRGSPGWLRGIAAATLLGAAIEMAWLVFPATGTAAWLGATTGLLALVVLTAASIGFFGWAAQGRLLPSRRPTP
jgi:hypothetical protein